MMKGLCNFQIKTYRKSRNIKRSNDKIYNKVENDKRLQLLQMVKDNKKSLKEASKLLEINYSTAKTILRVYRIENRILKKTTCSSNGMTNNDTKTNTNNEERMKISTESTTESLSSPISPLTSKLTIQNTSSSLYEYMSQLNALATLTQNYLNEVFYNEYILNNINYQVSQLFDSLISCNMKL